MTQELKSLNAEGTQSVVLVVLGNDYRTSRAPAKQNASLSIYSVYLKKRTMMSYTINATHACLLRLMRHIRCLEVTNDYTSHDRQGTIHVCMLLVQLENTCPAQATTISQKQTQKRKRNDDEYG